MLLSFFALLIAFGLGFFWGRAKSQREKRDFVWSREIQIYGDKIWKSRASVIEKFGLTFQIMRVPEVRTYRTSDPEVVKEILKNRNTWEKRPSGPTAQLFLANGLTSVNDDIWKRQHDTIAKLFTVSKVKTALPQLVKTVRSTLASFKLNPDSLLCDVNLLCSQISLHLIITSTLGTMPDVAVFAKDFYSVWKWYRSAESKRIDRKADIIKLKEKAAELIAQKQKSPEEDDGSFIGSLIKLSDGSNEGLGLKSPELLDNVFSFLLAGFETVAHTTTFCLWMLAEHLQEQDAVVQEIKSALEASSSVFDSNVFENLPRLQNVIKETLRLYHPVPGMQRHFRAETVTITDQANVERTFKREDIGIVDTIPMHRNPKIWEKAGEFIPSRWDKPTQAQMTHYLPFGLGSRVCIGQNFALLEIKVVLVIFLSMYRVAPGEHPKMMLTPTLSLIEGMILTVQSRE